MTNREASASIGAAVRAARMARAVTQDDLALLLKVDRVTISRYESGKRTIPAPALVQIADYLDLPLDTLTGQGGQRREPVPSPTRNTPEDEALQTVVRVLQQRPDLVPTVLDLLETLLDTPAGTAPTQRESTAAPGAAEL